MLAPIMTKDMKLFPSRPLPPKVKNVRSRAQSLQDFAHSNGTAINSARVVPARQRNAQSVGNIPSVSKVPLSKSPPKTSTIVKPTKLDAIVEGVEMDANAKPPKQPPIAKKKLSLQTPTSTSPVSNLSSPDNEKIGRAMASTSLHTSSTPSLNKDDSGNEESDTGSPSGKSMLKKLASIFKKDKSKDESKNEDSKEKDKEKDKDKSERKSSTSNHVGEKMPKSPSSGSNSTAT